MACLDYDTLSRFFLEEVAVMPVKAEMTRPDTPVVRHPTTASFFPGALPGQPESGRPDLTVKLILLGDYSVGKSSLLRILARQNYLYDSRTRSGDSDHNARSTPSRSSSLSSLGFGSCSHGGSVTSGNGSSRAVVYPNLKPGGFVDVWFTHQGKTVLARIADTGGQERYRSMTSSYYRGAHGCLLMFDVTKEESFENLNSWIENIDFYRPSDKFSCIIVGTRCNSQARKVVYERAAGYAEMRGLPYMELDMDHMTDVQRVFEALIDSVKVNLHKDPPLELIIPNMSNSDPSRKVVCSC